MQNNNKQRYDNNRTLIMIVMAMFIALSIVTTRFLSIETPYKRIGLGFIPVIVAAMYLSPLRAGIVGIIADLVGFFLFGKGVYFPGFTLTAFLGGFITSTFIEGIKASKIVNVITSAIVSTFICDTLLNTLWVTMMKHQVTFKAYTSNMILRLPNHLLLIVLKIVITSILFWSLVKSVRIRGVERYPISKNAFNNNGEK